MSNEQSQVDDSPVVKMTVSDYARATGDAESTIRTQIQRGRLKAVKEMIDGRERLLVVVDKPDERRDIPHVSVKSDALLIEQLVKNARLEERLIGMEALLEAKEAIIAGLKEQVATQEKTISSQETSMETIRNQSLAVTQQLQKYREPEPPKTERKGWGWPWKR